MGGARDLRDLLSVWEQSRSPLSPREIRQGLGDLHLSNHDVADRLAFNAVAYQRILIHRGDAFEALLICWRSGQRSPIHDHANSICAVYAISGLLSADNYLKTANGYVRADYSEDFRPGSVLTIQTTQIHQVSNLQDSSELISLHFYLGPLENSYLYSVTDASYQFYPRTYTRVFTLADGI